MFISDAYLSKHLSMKIFVSSTVKDLGDLRDELYRHLKELGHTPWFSEKSDFPANRHPDALTNCLKVVEECDFFVLLLDKRAGSHYGRREGSPYPDLFGLTISEAEYMCARKKDTPICIFIRNKAAHESCIYRQHDEETKKSMKWYSDPELYEFYDRLMHEGPHIPWRYTFDSINEIMEPLNARIGEVQSESSDSHTQIKFKETFDDRRSSAQLISPKNQITVELAKAHIDQGMYALAEGIIYKISDDAVKSEAYSALAKAHIDQGMYALAEGIIYKISDDAVKSEAYSALAKAHIDQGMYALAEGIIDRISKH